MPFDRGTMSFCVCRLPQALPDDAIARFQSKAAGPLEYVKEEPSLGWVSGRHLLETDINDMTAYAGGFLHLCLRQAQRKVPGALLQAETRMRELQRLQENGGEFLSRKERKEIKEDVIDRLMPQMPPQLGATPFVVDPGAERLYLGATSEKQCDAFLAYFYETMGFEPQPMTPEFAAAQAYEDEIDMLPVLNFSPELPDSDAWGAVGENFLTWLWFFCEDRNGVLPKTQLGEFSCGFEGPLVFVSEGDGAQESALRRGAPTISAEAKAALSVGKKLRRAKINLALSKDEIWSATIDAQYFTFRSLKVPEGEAMDPASVFEERMHFLHIFETAIYGLFKRFVADMSDENKFADTQERAKKWVESMPAK